MTDPAEGEDRISLIYDCLSDSRRRHVLRRLRESPEPPALADLAEDVADLEAESERSAVTAERVRDVYLSLYHRHVPKLAAADLVRYDRDREVVELLEYPDALDAVEEPVPQ